GNRLTTKLLKLANAMH
ncbi:hypothetical protein D039_4745B, partial [Vibrio parahaemolyticus EKP-028]